MRFKRSFPITNRQILCIKSMFLRKECGVGLFVINSTTRASDEEQSKNSIGKSAAMQKLSEHKLAKIVAGLNGCQQKKACSGT
jgi:hypothetical protein